MSLSYEQLVKALRDTDEAALADILAMGVTPAELAKAQAWIMNDEALINSGEALASGRLSRLVEILASIEEHDDSHHP